MIIAILDLIIIIRTIHLIIVLIITHLITIRVILITLIHIARITTDMEEEILPEITLTTEVQIII
jgi:hypothetical protein